MLHTKDHVELLPVGVPQWKKDGRRVFFDMFRFQSSAIKIATTIPTIVIYRPL